MPLRKEIEKAIADQLKATPNDTGAAAIAVCRLIENQLGLGGNGWWDDDPELQQLLYER